jgi:hypothetical protein
MALTDVALHCSGTVGIWSIASASALVWRSVEIEGIPEVD